MIVLINQLIVTIIIRGVAVPIDVINVVGIVFNGPIPINISCGRVKNPVCINIIRVTTIDPRVPIKSPVVAYCMNIGAYIG
jgi:hypothetical protein